MLFPDLGNQTWKLEAQHVVEQSVRVFGSQYGRVARVHMSMPPAQEAGPELVITFDSMKDAGLFQSSDKGIMYDANMLYKFVYYRENASLSMEAYYNGILEDYQAYANVHPGSMDFVTLQVFTLAIHDFKRSLVSWCCFYHSIQ
jgi:hypothetical protein